MNVTSSLALAVAERVERTGGPRAGMVAWKTLANNATDGEVRGKALLAALRCALALNDEAALTELSALWPSVDRGVWDAKIAVLCKDLVRAKLLEHATELAKTEAARDRTALSLYLYARCLDLARDPNAANAFREAILRAEKEGASEIERESRVRCVAILGRSWDTMSEALAEASLVASAVTTTAANLPPQSKLVLARVLLFAPSRFVRAGALSLLDDVANGNDVDALYSSQALALAAGWADDAGPSATPLETDRLVALLSRERIVKVSPQSKDVLRAADRILRAREHDLDAVLDEAVNVDLILKQQHTRAREILSGRFEVPREGDRLPADPTKRRAFRQQEILDVVVAMRDQTPARAARSLRMLAEAEERGEHMPIESLAVAEAALAQEDAELREVAARFFAARLRRASFGAPPRGYLALAEALGALGYDGVSATAVRAAVALKEPGAAESLGIALSRQGWELAKNGERKEAIQKLREAKALLDR